MLPKESKGTEKESKVTGKESKGTIKNFSKKFKSNVKKPSNVTKCLETPSNLSQLPLNAYY